MNLINFLRFEYYVKDLSMHGMVMYLKNRLILIHSPVGTHYLNSKLIVIDFKLYGYAISKTLFMKKCIARRKLQLNNY